MSSQKKPKSTGASLETTRSKDSIVSKGDSSLSTTLSKHQQPSTSGQQRPSSKKHVLSSSGKTSSSLVSAIETDESLKVTARKNTSQGRESEHGSNQSDDSERHRRPNVPNISTNANVSGFDPEQKVLKHSSANHPTDNTSHAAFKKSTPALVINESSSTISKIDRESSSKKRKSEKSTTCAVKKSKMSNIDDVEVINLKEKEEARREKEDARKLTQKKETKEATIIPKQTDEARRLKEEKDIIRPKGKKEVIQKEDAKRLNEKEKDKKRTQVALNSEDEVIPLGKPEEEEESEGEQSSVEGDTPAPKDTMIASDDEVASQNNDSADEIASSQKNNESDDEVASQNNDSADEIAPSQRNNELDDEVASQNNDSDDEIVSSKKKIESDGEDPPTVVSEIEDGGVSKRKSKEKLYKIHRAGVNGSEGNEDNAEVNYSNTTTTTNSIHNLNVLPIDRKFIRSHKDKIKMVMEEYNDMFMRLKVIVCEACGMNIWHTCYDLPARMIIITPKMPYKEDYVCHCGFKLHHIKHITGDGKKNKCKISYECDDCPGKIWFETGNNKDKTITKSNDEVTITYKEASLHHKCNKCFLELIR